MNGYLPEGMLQKQYRWESVNYQLYYRLNEINPYPAVKSVTAKMLKMQSQQLLILQRIAAANGISLSTEPLAVEYHHKFEQAVEEIKDREYQLLQEYLSVAVYFMAANTGLYGMLRALIESQTDQVNALTQLKQSISAKAENGHEPRDNGQQQEPAHRLEQGYRLEKVVGELTYPTVMAFDDSGSIYIAEAGFAYGTEPGEGRVLRIDREGAVRVAARGFLGPVTGIAWHRGALYVAEGARGGDAGPGCGKITKIFPDGSRKVIVSDLKTCGDHFTGDIEFGPDGRLYFTVGTATNSAVVGPDNREWLKYHPQFHDIPARPYVLNGKNFISPNPLSEQEELAVTGAYKPFGVSSFDGEVVPGELLANGVIYSCDADGGKLQVVADGFRNPFGLKFSPFDGKLYVTDNGADPRGSRQIHEDWDNFWEITPGGWYGFPDFFSGLPVILPHFHVEEKAKPTFLLGQHPVLAGQPQLRFEYASASHKFDFCVNPAFGHPGQIFVAQLGDMAIGEYEERYGFKVVRANVQTGQIRDFLVNPLAEENKNGPIRPVQAKFSPDGSVLYVVDFGILGSVSKGKKPQPRTGSLWRIVRA